MSNEKTTAEDRRFMENAEALSDSTRRARWIHGVDEHEDHAGETLATRNHEVIQDWAERRAGVPATVPGTEHGDRAGVLRFDFGGDSEGLEHIGWDEWFRTFDERELVFVYQEHLSNGNDSNFFRFDSPHREDA